MAHTNNLKQLEILPIEEGIQARDSGMSRHDNPYNRDKMPLSYVAWNEGWYEADRDASLKGMSK